MLGSTPYMFKTVSQIFKQKTIKSVRDRVLMAQTYKGTETAEPMVYKLPRRPTLEEQRWNGHTQGVQKYSHSQSRDKTQSGCYWLFPEQLVVLVYLKVIHNQKKKNALLKISLLIGVQNIR